MKRPCVNKWGYTKNGEEVTCVTITDGANCFAEIISYGAAIRSLCIPDKDGHIVDVCLGYDTLSEYEDSNSCFGATMGRCVDRIAGAHFWLMGKEYHLSENRKGFHIHGGYHGFHKKVWQYELRNNTATFTYCSPDGEDGYPGKVTARVSYQFISHGVLQVTYEADCDSETVINLTNHSYFNLDGHNSGSATGSILQIPANYFAEVGENNIPTGKMLPTLQTPLDFMDAHSIAERIDSDHLILRQVGGYDHCFFLSQGWKRAATLCGEKLGIRMDVFTDFPVLHLYSANFLAEQLGKGGAVYGRYHGICLETEYLPNAVNLENIGSKPIFSPIKRFSHKTQFCFTNNWNQNHHE